MRKAACLAFLVGFAATPLVANVFTVVNTNDSGAGSLRQAILNANSHLGADSIEFAIPGSGVHTIALASALPDITDPVTIDGYSQPGSSPNTNPTGQGLNTVLTIEIDGTAVSSSTPCLNVLAGNFGILAMVVQGLVINRCAGTAIKIGIGGDETWIVGNFLGTDPTGTFRPAGPQFFGVFVQAPGVQVGGTSAFARNLVSGFDGEGVEVHNVDGVVVAGNLIGTNAGGTAAIGNGTGVGIFANSQATVGGPTASHRNVISGNGIGVDAGGRVNTVQGNLIGTDITGTQPLGNTDNGVQVPAANDDVLIQSNVISANGAYGVATDFGSSGGLSTVVKGNFIGTDETATLDLGNAFAGIFVYARPNWTIGGVAAGEGNVIAHNGRGSSSGTVWRCGVTVLLTTGVAIRGNRMFDNAPFGINLDDGDGFEVITPNDSGDSDTGPNNLQNYPMITSVVPGASTTHIEGLLDSKGSMTFDIDLFSASCLVRPHDFVQGETFLATLQVTTDINGDANFATDVPVVLAPNDVVTATATDPNGNTSEFSQRIVFSLDPPFGPAAGDVQSTLSGMLFEPGATVTVGGAPATGVNVLDPTTITAFMPARPAGSVSDVTVTDPSGVTGTLINGWIADFLDVPGGQQFHDFVVTLFSNGITSGIGGGNYGVNNSTLRQQMAVFLLKGKHGLCYTPPPCKGIFPDVPCPSQFADWIEALFNEGITGGCGGGDFCPTNPVLRQQMAVFLLKAEHGASYTPPPCTGVFPDVPCPSLFADWIEALAAENITGGCGGGNFCPMNPNTRGQMAVFIVKTFNLQ